MEEGGGDQKNKLQLNSERKKNKNQGVNSHTKILCPSVTNCFTGFGQSRRTALYEQMSSNEVDSPVSVSDEKFGKSEYQTLAQIDQSQQQYIHAQSSQQQYMHAQQSQQQQQQVLSVYSDQTYSDINLLDEDEEDAGNVRSQNQDETPKLPFWRSKLAKGHRSSSDASSSSTFMRFFHRQVQSLDTVQDTINVGRMYGNTDDSITSQTSVSDLLSSTSPYPQQDLQENHNQHKQSKFHQQQQQLTSQNIEEHQHSTEENFEQQQDEQDETAPKKKLSLWKSVTTQLSMFRNMGSLETSSKEGGSQKEGGGGGSRQGDEAKTPADASKVEEMQLEMAIAESKRLHRGMGSIDNMDCGDPEGAYVDAGVRLTDEGWWRKRISTRANQHSVALDVDVFYAQFDQRSSKAEGYAACACMSVVMAEWLLQNPGKLPVQKDQFEELLLTGAQDWQLIQQSMTDISDSNRSNQNDGHIYLETALERPGRRASLVADGQFVVFLRPMEGGSNSLDCPPLEEYLSSTPSVEEIWKEMEQRAPCVFIVAWNEHFALLEFMDDGRVFFVDTLGDRLHEGCDRAYILRFPCTPADQVPQEAPMRRIHSAPNISMSLPMHNGSPSTSLDIKHRRLQSIDESTDEKFQDQIQAQISSEDWKGGDRSVLSSKNGEKPRSENSSVSQDEIEVDLQEEKNQTLVQSKTKNQSKFSYDNFMEGAKSLFFRGKKTSQNSTSHQAEYDVQIKNEQNQEEKKVFLSQTGNTTDLSVSQDNYQGQTEYVVQFKTKDQIDQILSQSDNLNDQNLIEGQNQQQFESSVSAQDNLITKKFNFRGKRNKSVKGEILSQEVSQDQQGKISVVQDEQNYIGQSPSSVFASDDVPRGDFISKSKYENKEIISSSNSQNQYQQNDDKNLINQDDQVQVGLPRSSVDVTATGQKILHPYSILENDQNLSEKEHQNNQNDDKNYADQGNSGKVDLSPSSVPVSGDVTVSGNVVGRKIPIPIQIGLQPQKEADNDQNQLDQGDSDKVDESPSSAPVSVDVTGRNNSVPIQLGLQSQKEPTLLTPEGGANQCRTFLQYVYTHTPVYELGTRYEAARKRGVAPLDWFLDCQQVLMKTLQIEFRQLKVINQ